MSKADLYISQLKRLLPKGKAWTAPVGSLFEKLIKGFADELVRIDDRVDDILEEADPRTATETLDQWESELDLPDDCSEIPGTDADRRNAIVAKLILTGPQNKQLYIDLAASLGYTIDVDDIVEFREFKVDESSIGDALWDRGWVFTFKVVVPSVTTDPELECIISRAKPAHTYVVFEYE